MKSIKLLLLSIVLLGPIASYAAEPCDSLIKERNRLVQESENLRHERGQLFRVVPDPDDPGALVKIETRRAKEAELVALLAQNFQHVIEVERQLRENDCFPDTRNPLERTFR